jgi:prephenate dehydratase
VTEAAASHPAPLAPDMPARRVGYLGPAGTFTEQALLTQPDLAEAKLVPIPSIPEVLAATASREVDYGFVAIENAIEGSVNITLDVLAFETDLLIQREVVIPVELCLLALPGVVIDDIDTVQSFPHASAQCARFLAESVPGVRVQATNSTAEAARLLAETDDRSRAAIGTARAAEVYGLAVLAAGIEDHPENATRFVVVARHDVPAETGHDKTSLVVFQRADEPGSLLSILQEFAARAINLSKLESRPTKRGLGDYCFLIDLEGHLEDEVVADALRNLKMKQADVKFLGSYPAAGEQGPAARAAADARWSAAVDWVDDLRSRIRP